MIAYLFGGELPGTHRDKECRNCLTEDFINNSHNGCLDDFGQLRDYLFDLLRANTATHRLDKVASSFHENRPIWPSSDGSCCSWSADV